MACVTRDELGRLHAGELGEGQAREVREHLASCAACAGLSESVVRQQEAVLDQLRQMRARARTFDLPGGGGESGGELAEGDAAGEVGSSAGAETAGGAGRGDEQGVGANAAAGSDEGVGAKEGAAAEVVIGGYRLVRKIGAGGMGTVYEAEQAHPRRRVALKVMKNAIAGSRTLKRFEQEAHVLGRLQHPGIAQVFESGVHRQPGSEPVPFFAMELIRGMALNRFAAARKLTVRTRLELFVRIVDAVQYAHTKGVIHRDLKPGNVLVTEDGQPKILDFGVARADDVDLQVTSLETGVGAIVGTIPYMSPEQVSGRPDELDTRSDVYSLGVMLYELLVGRLPHDLRNRAVLDAVRIIREIEPIPLSRVDRTLRGDVATIVSKALEKDKTRRYQTAQDLASDVRRYLNDEPISARPASATYQLSKFARRHTGLVAGVAAALAMLVGGTVLSTTLYFRAEARRQEAVEARDLERISKIQALRAQEQAEARQKETQQVAEFSARMLSEIDVEAMGAGMKERLREQVRLALERQPLGEGAGRRNRTSAEVESELAEFDRRAGMAQAADVARRVLDEFVLRPAGESARRQFTDRPLVQAQLLEAIGATYRELGLYDAAESNLRSALELRRRRGSESPALVAESLNSLALLMRMKGGYAEAERLYAEALEIRKRELGEKSPEYLTTMHNVGALLREKGDLDGAEKLLRDVLARRVAVLGDGHRDVAVTRDQLATVLSDKGNYDEAEQLYRQALAALRATPGGAEAQVAFELNNLAVVVEAKGDYTAAEQMLREAVAIRRRLLGDEHVNVTVSLNNLAGVLLSKEDLDGAEAIYREILSIDRRMFGEVHGSIATVLSNLASVLKEKRKFDEAETLFRQALEMQRKIAGEDNAAVASTLNNIATVMQARGDLDGAEPLFRQSLELRRRLLGADHPEVVVTLNNLAVLLNAKGDYGGAEGFLREALELFKKRLGEAHPYVATAKNNLAMVLMKKGDLPAAAELLREVVSVRRKLLGDGHVDVVKAANNLAEALRRAGKYSEAEPLYREVTAGLEKRLGAGDRAARLARARLARCWLEAGRLAEAEEGMGTAFAQPTDVAALNDEEVREVCETWLAVIEKRRAAEAGYVEPAEAAGWRERCAGARADRK